MNEFESNLPKTFRNGGGQSPKDCPYSDDDLARINAEFDRANGWQPGMSPVFTNAKRLHETHYGPPETAWQNRT